MKHHGMAALAAAATLLFSTPVPASVHLSGHAGFSNVRFTVVDLTPDDNAVAGFDMTPRLGNVYWNIFDIGYDNATGGNHHQAMLHSAVPVHLAMGDGATHAQVDADGGFGSAGFAFDSNAALGYSAALAQGRRALTIVLRPNTALSISGYADGWLTRARRMYGGEEFTTSSSVWTALHHISVVAPEQTFARSLTLGQDDLHGEYGEEFSFSAVNDRDYDIELSLAFNGHVSYSANLLPVPEPSTWLMLATGLLAVAGCTRPAGWRAA